MSKTSSFAKYYSDPKYKEKHLKYMKEKVLCDCGLHVARANITTHKKTLKHCNIIKIKTNNKNTNPSLIEIDYIHLIFKKLSKLPDYKLQKILNYIKK